MVSREKAMLIWSQKVNIMKNVASLPSKGI